MRRKSAKFPFVLLPLLLLLGVLWACRPPAEAEKPSAARGGLPRVDHIVVVVEENRSFDDIYGNPSAPYINKLMAQGANLVNHYAVEHPSQPNYLDLFSGSNQGVRDDRPNHTFRTDNLAAELIRHGYTFGGYSEGLPKTGYTGPYNLKTGYARKHNPWADFANVPGSVNMPLSAFPRDYAKLPTVSFVIPNLDHDMHDGTVKQADDWLKEHLAGYVGWAQKHNSLLILTWDEDDTSHRNRIPTVIVGPMVKPGDYKAKTNHYNVLRTIGDLYGLSPLGHAKEAKPLAIWR
jgi:hypothetical protein